MLLGAAIVIVLLGALVTAALYSETVFRETLRIVQPMIPGELKYGEIYGTLSGPIEAVNVDYEIAGTRVRVAQLRFDPSLFALLRGRVSLGDVDAENLEIRLPPPDDDAEDGPPPSPQEILETLRLPVDIHARSLKLDNVALLDGRGETLLALERLDVRLDWNRNALIVNDLDAVGPDMEVRGNVSLGLAPGNASTIDVEGHWHGRLPFPLAGRVHGEGDAESLRLDVQLHSPGDIALDSQLHDLLDAPRW
jgi:autotransporter translocation and assembly factor TamB